MNKLTNQLLESSAVKVKIDRSVIRQIDPDMLTGDMAGENIWVTPLEDMGIWYVAKLCNEPESVYLGYGYYVVVIKGEGEGRWDHIVMGSDDLRDVQEFAEEDGNIDGCAAIVHAFNKKLWDKLCCAKCKTPYAARSGDPDHPIWMVKPEAWAKVPTKFQKRIICKSCFAELTGLDADEHSMWS